MSKLEKVKQEKDGIDFKIEKFDKTSKDLDQLLGSQITDKSSFVESSPNVDKETVFPANKKVEFTKPENHDKPVKKQVRISVHEAKRHYYTGRHYAVNTARSYSGQVNAVRVKGVNAGKPQHDDKGFVDSGCLRHMTGNIAYLSDFKQFDGGYVAFGGGTYGGRITEHVEYLMLNASPFEVENFYCQANVNAVKMTWAPNIKTHLGISEEAGTLTYLSLVVPLTKVGDEAVHKELGDRMERDATTASS
ncbi:hypothetical protein Tco_1411932 [Tanacetum coccineum]